MGKGAESPQWSGFEQLLENSKSHPTTLSVHFSCSVMSDSLWPPWTTACQTSLSVTNARIHVHQVSDAIQPSHPLSSPSPPVFSLPQHRVFSSESVLHVRCPKYYSVSFNISPSSEHSGLISFRNDCFNLLAVQGTLKSLLQHHTSKASILQSSAFFMVQLSHPYITTGKSKLWLDLCEKSNVSDF